MAGLDPQEAEENLATLKKWNEEATAVVQGTAHDVSFTKDQLNGTVGSCRKHEAVIIAMMKSLGSRK